MTTIALALWHHWNKNRTADVQICLRGVPMPIRGKLTCLNEADVGAPGDGDVLSAPPLFELEAEAQEGQQKFVLPITFAAEDVAWFSGGPRLVEKPSIIAPGSGLTPGGLSVGGRA